MKTILDEGNTWFLLSLEYEDDLTIRLVEGIQGSSLEDVRIGTDVIKNAYPIEVASGSKRATVRFAARVPVAWQVVDESFTAWDKNEVRDAEGCLQVISKSRYLDYVNDNHGWYKDVVGAVAHYRIWTENQVIDVVALEPPNVVWGWGSD